MSKHPETNVIFLKSQKIKYYCVGIIITPNLKEFLAWFGFIGFVSTCVHLSDLQDDEFIYSLLVCPILKLRINHVWYRFLQSEKLASKKFLKFSNYAVDLFNKSVNINSFTFEKLGFFLSKNLVSFGCILLMKYYSAKSYHPFCTKLTLMTIWRTAKSNLMLLSLVIFCRARVPWWHILHHFPWSFQAKNFPQKQVMPHKHGKRSTSKQYMHIESALFDFLRPSLEFSASSLVASFSGKTVPSPPWRSLLPQSIYFTLLKVFHVLIGLHYSLQWRV